MSPTTPSTINLDQAAENLNLKAGSVSLDPLAELYNVTFKRREDARMIIAIMIVVSLPATVLATFLTLWFCGKVSIDDLIKIIGAIMSPIIGLIGAVTGFYFSESKHRDVGLEKT